MSIPEIRAIIAATDQVGGIGKNGRIPWRNTTDMKFFKTMTTNSVVIMGRTTYEELNSYTKYKNVPVLANRIAIVVSSTLSKDEVFNAHVVSSINDAYNLACFLAAPRGYNIFFIGGTQIFREAVPYINNIYLNTVEGAFDCDTTFPFDILDNFQLTNQYQLENVLMSTYKLKSNN